MNAKRREKKPGKLRRGLLIALCVVLALILAVLIGATIYLESMLGLINRVDPNDTRQYMTPEEYEQLETDDSDYSGPTKDPNDVEWGDPAESIGAGKNIINIMLVGQDRRAGESRARSDAMILCTVNKSEKTITFTSFMRDMYVQIPGYKDNRINASYAFGGMELLNSTLDKNFGVQIDGNVEIDFFAFQKVIDTLGGIDVELTAAEASYLNRRGNWDLEQNAGKWTLKAGVNRLNGSQATAYTRIREVGNGDFGRTNRQRIVLGILIDKAKSMSLPEINKLLTTFLPMVTTDMTNAEIMGFAIEIFPMLSDLTINTQQIPANGAYQMTMIRKMSVLLPNLEKNRAILKQIMGEA